jgi:hypothetical protein
MIQGWSEWFGPEHEGETMTDTSTTINPDPTADSGFADNLKQLQDAFAFQEKAEAIIRSTTTIGNAKTDMAKAKPS